MQHRQIAFIGAGNMSRSIISGMITNGYPSGNIIASNPSTNKLDALERDFGIFVTTSNKDAVARSEVIVLAVKPQIMNEMCQNLQQDCDLTNKLFISIAAGIQKHRLQQMLGADYPIIRTMPNTPSFLGKGMTGLYADNSITEQDKNYASELMKLVGEIAWVDNENMIDAVVAAAGSSPAYFFYFLENMHKEAMNQGFDSQTARLLVQQAMSGAADMVCQNPHLELSELRAQVTSKGGSTAKAIEYFEQHDLQGIVAGAMQATVKRSQEMAQQF